MMSSPEYKKARAKSTKNAKICNKECIITGLNPPQVDYAHIIPLNLCLELYKFNGSQDAYLEEAAYANGNMLPLNKNLHSTYELENFIPTWTLKRIGIKGRTRTNYKLIILKNSLILEEQQYENEIYSISNIKIPYLDLHYKICCYHYNIKDDDISLLSYNRNMFSIFCIYKKYRESKPKNIELNNKKRKLIGDECCINKEDQLWVIKRILKKRCIKNKTSFLIEWDGRDKNGRKWKDSWEPEQNIPPDIIYSL